MPGPGPKHRVCGYNGGGKMCCMCVMGAFWEFTGWGFVGKSATDV